MTPMNYVGNYPWLMAIITGMGGFVFAYTQPSNWVFWTVACFALCAWSLVRMFYPRNGSQDR
jgi:hypothetical protein